MIRHALLTTVILSVATPHVSVGGIRFKPEDFIFAFIALYVLLKPAVIRFRTVPVRYLLPFGAVTASVISACLSGYYGDVVTPGLTALKWIEYGFIFVIAYCIDFKQEDFKFLSSGVVIAAIAFSLFGLLQPAGTIRAFDAPPFVGESNHIGFVCALGALLAVNDGRLLYYAAAAASVVGLMLSGSRSATIALACGLLSFFLFTRKRAAVALLCGVALTFLIWPLAVERLVSGIHSEVSLYVKNMERESVGQPRLIAAVNRIQNADTAVRESGISPIFGLGPGVRHRIFYENQYAMWIGDSGMLGFAAFTFLIAAAYFSVCRESPILASVIVMYLVFALFCESFFVTRLAPFIWVCMGMGLYRAPDSIR